jgi:hypothetical protein
MVRSICLFLVWAVVGSVESFALLYGIVLAPFFVAIGWCAYRYVPKVSDSRLPEGFGALAGFGAFWLFIVSAIDGDASLAASMGLLALGISVVAYLAEGRARCQRGLATR